MRVEINVDDDVIIVDKLFIKFDVSAKSNDESAGGVITVRNISQNSRQRIEQSGKKVRLFAGYNDLFQIFEGSIKRIEHKFEEPEIDTLIHVGVVRDKSASWLDSFPGETKLIDIVQKALAVYDLPVGDISAIPIEAIENDYSTSGPVEQALNKLLKPRGLRHYEENGHMHVAAISNRQGQEILIAKLPETLYPVEINRDTGMIGTPEAEENGAWRVKTKLREGFVLGESVNVSSRYVTIDKPLKIVELNCVGDNWTGEFNSELLLKSISDDAKTAIKSNA